MWHQSIYVRMVPMFAGVLLMILLVIVGVMLAVDASGARDWSIRLILGGVGVGVAAIFSLPLFLSRRRWTLTDAGLEVRQGPALLPRSCARSRTVPFSDIAGISRVFVGAREAVTVSTRTGRDHHLMIRSDAPLVAALAEAAGRAQGRPLTVGEGLGFWAGKVAIVMIALALVLSLVIAGAALVAFLDGGLTFSGGSAAGKGFWIVLALPAGLGWVLVKIVRRRARVLGPAGGR